ncbi:MAG: beta-lactamase family protein [Actinomycetota bacterium]|nr:beta-lactamase family protein [Actinomycetota bacterium]
MGRAPALDLSIVASNGELDSRSPRATVSERGEIQPDGSRVPVDPAWLAATLSALIDAHGVPGAQLAVHGGGVTVAVEAGELKHGTGTAVTQETAFPIGSISKVWTATLAMILVADDDLELDAPLVGYLPELDDLGGQLTLRHLLSHTSGFADSPEPTPLSPARYVRENCRRQDLIVPPGTGFSYSSRNYVVAGHLIEKLTGMSWWDAMEAILLRPLGIVPAAVVGTAVPARYERPIATGHSVNTTLGRIRPAQQSLPAAEAPAGALAMSAVNLVALGLMHIGPGVPELLPASYAEQMRQVVAGAEPFGLADGWGCGLAVFRDGQTDWVGHDGNADGTSCYLRIEPAGGWVVALTTNANTGSALWDELSRQLRSANVPLAVHRREHSPHAPVAPPAECTGRFSNGRAEHHVTADDDGLYLAIGDERAARLAFYADLEFELQDLASGQSLHVGRFLRDPITRRVQQLQIGGRIAQRRLAAVPEPRSRAHSTTRAST